MMALAEFLNARLDELHALAENADGESWYMDDGEYTVRLLEAWSAERVLADIASKRATVELWEYRWREANDATEEHMNSMYASQATGLGNAVRLMAKVYSDHPDYDPDWNL